MGLTRELLNFEKAVVDFGSELDNELRKLCWTIDWNDDEVATEESMQMLHDKLVTAARELRTRQRVAAGLLLLRAVEVSKRVIDVENQHLKEQV